MSPQDRCIPLNNGHKIPIVALGTFQTTLEEFTTALEAAVDVGYRHIDTAFMYQNEAIIGKALKKLFESGKVKREDMFIVTKLPPKGMYPGGVEKYFKKSLEALQLDYVDLYLIHGPMGLQDVGDALWPMDESGNSLIDKNTDLVAVWKSMEAQVDAGRAKSIGLSNFSSSQIARIVKAARIRPVALQIELNVYFQQRELVAFCRALDITTCAYSVIGSPDLGKFLKTDAYPESAKLDPLKDPVVCRIAKHHNKTPAQVLMRHCMQRNIVVIRKSTNPGRIKENFEVFDFELSEEDMDDLAALDKRQAGRRFRLEYSMKGISDHPEFHTIEPY